MNTKEFNELTKSIKEITRIHIDAQSDITRSVKTAASSAGGVNTLYKNGNKSFLIKAGLALIVFPEPIVSDMLGTALLAAGAVQEGIRRQSIYLDDLPKAFQKAMNDLKYTKELI